MRGPTGQPTEPGKHVTASQGLKGSESQPDEGRETCDPLADYRRTLEDLRALPSLVKGQGCRGGTQGSDSRRAASSAPRDVEGSVDSGSSEASWWRPTCPPRAREGLASKPAQGRPGLEGGDPLMRAREGMRGPCPPVEASKGLLARQACPGARWLPQGLEGTGEIDESRHARPIT